MFAENQFAQPRSPLVDLDEYVEEEEHSFEGALDLRPPRAESDVAGASAGAAVAAATPVFQFERPARFTRKGPHRLDEDLVSKMAEACVKNRPSASLAPEEVIAAAFRVLDHQEELEYAELRAANLVGKTAASPTEERLRFLAKARNFDVMLDRLLRIYVLTCMRIKDAEGFAAAEKARTEAVCDANGIRRLPIHMGIADGMYQAMINNEWAAFDNMHLLPETGNRA